MGFISRNIDAESYQKKVVVDYIELASKVNACKVLGAKIVLTIGSWDMLHRGHLRYLVKAHQYGDLLVAGVDSNEAIKKYKGPHRPIIDQDSRMEMLSYQACVDFVTLVDDVDEKGNWQYKLLKMIRPEFFVAVEDSYPEEQREQIRLHSRELIILPRQDPDASSTDIIENVIKRDPKRVRELLERSEVGVAHVK